MISLTCKGRTDQETPGHGTDSPYLDIRASRSTQTVASVIITLVILENLVNNIDRFSKGTTESEQSKTNFVSAKLTTYAMLLS